jgi:hypothetical protein
MKRAVILLFAIVVGLSACQNINEDDLHPDSGLVTGYFSYQFPVRTIILGDYIYDNSNDNAHKCIIYAHIGGVRENKIDRKFTIEVDNSLCDNILFSAGGDPIVAMPDDYYTLSSSTELIVPRGSMFGGVEVQLSEAFFNDPLSIKNTYVIPIRLKSSNDVDSILSGLSAFPADERIVKDWMIKPQNFTMYAVKYINEYDAVYLHYGKSSLKDENGAVLADSIYKERYVEYNRTYKLATTGRRSVQTAPMPFRTKVGNGMTGTYQLVLNFGNDNKCTVEAPADAAYTVTGTGEFISKLQDEYTSWGNKDRDVIKVNYSIVNSTGNTYTAEDVFVIQVRNVAIEKYSPALVPDLD